MTNYEYLKNVNIEQLSHFLCDETDLETFNSFPDDDACDRCPVNGRCIPGRNGWLSWLKEEKK